MAGWRAAPRLQQAVEAPEGQQQRVRGGRAKQDVDRGGRHQAACRMQAIEPETLHGTITWQHVLLTPPFHSRSPADAHA